MFYNENMGIYEAQQLFLCLKSENCLFLIIMKNQHWAGLMQSAFHEKQHLGPFLLSTFTTATLANESNWRDNALLKEKTHIFFFLAATKS